MNVICTVNYKNYEVTEKFIDSYVAHKFKNSILIIVDNDSSERKISKLKSKYIQYENIYFVAVNENLGYFGGAFSALEFYKDNISNINPDYFAICNNDLLLSPGVDWQLTLNKLCLTFPKLGVVGPNIKKLHNLECQNPFLIHRPNKNHYWKWRLIYSHILVVSVFEMLNKFRKLIFKNKVRTSMEEAKVYAAHGALLILTKMFLDSDYKYKDIPFLYCEEISLAEHCRQNDFDVVVTPQIEVLHNEHQTTESRITKFKFEKISEAQRFILKEYYK
ncbi:glycosyltransferase family 2 protein [Vibrio cholerae]